MYDNSIEPMPAPIARENSLKLQSIAMHRPPLIVGTYLNGDNTDVFVDSCLGCIAYQIRNAVWMGRRQAQIVLNDISTVNLMRLSEIAELLVKNGYTVLSSGNDSMAELLIQW